MAVFKNDGFASFCEIEQALREAKAIGAADKITSFADVAAVCSKKTGKIVNVNGFVDATMEIRAAFGADVVGIDDPDFVHKNAIQSGPAIQ